MNTTSFNKIVREFEGANLSKIGRSHGVYISWNNHQWKVVKLNSFFQLLRNWLGFFSSTHLNTVIPNLRKLEIKKLDPEARKVQQAIINCWLNHYQEQTHTDCHPATLDDTDFLRVFEVILEKGIKIMAPHTGAEGLFRSSGDEIKMKSIQKDIFLGELPPDNLEMNSPFLYAALIKRFTTVYNNRLQEKFFSNEILKAKIGELRKFVIQYETAQSFSCEGWKGWQSVSFPQLQEVCVALNLKRLY